MTPLVILVFIHVIYILSDRKKKVKIINTGRQWLSGRVLDSRSSVSWFEPNRHHCIVSLSSKTHKSLLSTGSTQEDQSHHNLKIVAWDVKIQISNNQNKLNIQV